MFRSIWSRWRTNLVNPPWSLIHTYTPTMDKQRSWLGCASVHVWWPMFGDPCSCWFRNHWSVPAGDQQNRGRSTVLSCIMKVAMHPTPANHLAVAGWRNDTIHPVLLVIGYDEAGKGLTTRSSGIKQHSQQWLVWRIQLVGWDCNSILGDDYEVDLWIVSMK